MRNVKNTQEDRESVGSSVDSPPDDLAIIHNRKELIPDRQDLSPRPAPVSQATPRGGAHTRDHPCLRGESIRLRPPQGMAGTRATGVPGGPLHGRAPHARSGERLLPPDPWLAGLGLAAHGSGPGRARIWPSGGAAAMLTA